MASNWLRRLAGLAVPQGVVGAIDAPTATLQVAPLDDAALSQAIEQVHGFICAGRWDDAKTALSRLLLSNQRSPAVLTYEGIRCYLQGEIEDAMHFLSLALDQGSENPAAAKFLAACFESSRDDARALAVNEAAVRLNPNDAQVLCVAAALYTRLGEFPRAATLLNRALKAEPDGVLAVKGLEALSKRSTFKRELYQDGLGFETARQRIVARLLAEHRSHGLDAESLGTLLVLLEGDAASFATALEVARASIGFEPMNADLAEQIASIFWMAGQGQDMLSLRERAHRIAPSSKLAQLGLSHARLMQGSADWQDAWASMTRLAIETHPEVHPVGARQWQGEALGKGKLLVYQDQGVGDALMAFRFLDQLKERGIAFDLWVVPSLSRLAAELVGAHHVLRQPELPSSVLQYTYVVPLFGLIPALGVSIDDLARVSKIHIAAHHAVALRTLVQQRSGIKIGLTWGGNPNRRDDWMRRVPLEAFAHLAQLPGVSWVNLSIDPSPEKAHVLASFQMLDPMQGVGDFLDTAAVIDGLDAVVAIDSSVAHLAAALGKPVWVVVPTMLDWRWQIGDKTSPWWPAAHLHRADAKNGFRAAMKKVKSELEAFCVTAKQPPHANSGEAEI